MRAADDRRPVNRDIAAVIFDLDGVLLDSETVWDDARRQLVAQHGRTWPSTATRAMMGMSSSEWSAYLHDQLGVPLTPPEISNAVVAAVADRYDKGLPLFPHARETVRALAKLWPLGLASSSNRPIIEQVLDKSALRPSFAASVSSEEVARGKPAPDVYLETARRLSASADQCVAIEDSTNGIHAAVSAGMPVIAIPNTHFPPTPDALDLAAATITKLEDLTDELIRTAFPA
jgi:HAD superfamily hydrolase (TIGR01509 family)